MAKKVKAKNKRPCKAWTAEREAKFIAAFYGDANQNVTVAARMAGYEGGDKHCSDMGGRLMRRPSVQAIIQKRLEAVNVTRSKVLETLELHRTADIMDVFSIGEDGQVRFDLAKSVLNKRTGVVKGLKLKSRRWTTPDGVTVEEQEFDVKLHDSQNAAVELGHVLGMFIEKHQQVNPDAGPATIEEYVDRLLEMKLPLERWPAGVRRFYERKRVESKVIDAPTPTP